MKSRLRLLVPILLVSSVLALSLASSAKADTVYAYIGQPFTTFKGGFACPSICNLTGSFTVSTALGDNLTLQPITPTSFSFTDGVTTIADTTPGGQLAYLLVGTNATGAIDSWNIGLTLPGTGGSFNIGSADTRTINEAPPTDDTFFFTNLISDSAAVFNSPGTWSITTTATPEPSSWLLLAGGLTGLWGLRRKACSKIAARAKN